MFEIIRGVFVSLIIAVASTPRTSADSEHSGSVFRSLNDSSRIKIISEDELELTPNRDSPHFVCKYSRDGDSLRVIATVLGSPQAMYFKFVPEGLKGEDGTILYDAAHFETATKAAVAERQRQLAAAISPSPSPSPSAARLVTASEAKALAMTAPRPNYPYELRARKITGSGVAKLVVDPSTGSVVDVTMVQSTGSPILDNSTVSAFHRWRFKPGTVREVRMPIT
jgi:TonB family protein